jgi:hypothetical protein
MAKAALMVAARETASLQVTTAFRVAAAALQTFVREAVSFPIA